MDDDPEMDGTECAHPAWWRGHIYTYNEVCRIINSWLDGGDDGYGSYEGELETIRQKIRKLTDGEK